MKKIIAFTGYKNCGKDTAANILETCLLDHGGVKKLSIAQPIKQITTQLFDVTLEELESLKRNQHHKIMLVDTSFMGRLKFFLFGNNRAAMTIREFFMYFGTNIMRSFFGDNVWINILKQEIKKNNADFIIISDLRFKSEYKALSQIKDYSLYIIKISRPDAVLDTNHASETEINHIPAHYKLDNNGTIKDLEYNINDILVNILSTQDK